MLQPTAPLPASLVRRWHQHGFLGPERIGWMLDAAATRWPDREALVTASGTYTFEQLAQRSRAIAAQLLAAGVVEGDVVTWTLPNDVDALTVPAAVWRIGAINNPVVAIYRAHELSFILDQLRPKALVVPVEYRGRRFAEEIDGLLRHLDHSPAARLSVGYSEGWTELDTTPEIELPATVEPASAEQVCIVLYTSGTTAAPKGVMHTGASLVHETKMMALDWGLTWRDTLFMASPLTHITGLLQGFLLPMLVGGRAVLQDRWDPAEAVTLLEEWGVTYTAGATPFLKGVVGEYQERGHRPRTLRQFTSGGAAVPSDLIAEADDLGIKAHRLWGMTELPTATRANERHDFDHRARTDGEIAWPVEVEVVDDRHHPLPVGTEGELRLRGPERMVGYVDARLNEEAIDEDGWFYSGDVGTIDHRGRVTITGRIKEIINRGGEKFSVRDIEDVLIRHPRIRDVAVVGLPDERLGEAVCAAVVYDRPVDDTSDAWKDELVAFLHEQGIARQKVPANFHALEALPRTPTGKLQRFKIIDEWE